MVILPLLIDTASDQADFGLAKTSMPLAGFQEGFQAGEDDRPALA